MDDDRISDICICMAGPARVAQCYRPRFGNVDSNCRDCAVGVDVLACSRWLARWMRH